jgi:uncharacterized protein YaeQ
MALKPTIYKFDVSLADMDRNCYESLALTVARHPSETTERMLVRVLARGLYHHEQLTFTRGLSENEEPDLWQQSLDGQIERWIEVGEPSLERLKKASRRAREVVVVSFNTRAEVWWRQLAEQLPAGTATVYRLDWQPVQTLAGYLQRTGELSLTINRPSIFVAAVGGEVELTLHPLNGNQAEP